MHFTTGLLLAGATLLLLLCVHGHTSHAGFTLHSTAFTDNGTLPVEFTGDGASLSPPLDWHGAPRGTRAYALIMHHIAPDKTKWYWVLYNIPPDVHALPKGAHGIGLQGNNSVNKKTEYAPPHSKGPGKKTYILTLYALDAPLQLTVKPETVNRDVLLAAMQGHILASAAVHVSYTRYLPGQTPPGEQDTTAPPPPGR